MKFLERAFYRGYWNFGNGSSATIKNWFKVKDNTFRGLELVKRRRRRSIRIRDIRLRFDFGSRLYEFTSKAKRNFRRLWIREY